MPTKIKPAGRLDPDVQAASVCLSFLLILLTSAFSTLDLESNQPLSTSLDYSGADQRQPLSPEILPALQKQNCKINLDVSGITDNS